MDRQKTTLCMLMAMLVIAIPVSSYSQTQTIASNPDNSSVNVEADTAGIKTARKLRDSGEYKQAKELLEEIIASQNPDILAEAYNGLGIVFIKLGEFQEAESVLKQALQWAEASDKPDINANLAYVFDGQGRFKEAEELHNISKGNGLKRPARWGGYLLMPNKIEFWKNESNRLHKRELFTLASNKWKKTLLSP